MPARRTCPSQLRSEGVKHAQPLRQPRRNRQHAGNGHEREPGSIKRDGSLVAEEEQHRRQLRRTASRAKRDRRRGQRRDDGIDDRNQESMWSSTDTDLMQIDGPTTAEEKHSDRVQIPKEDAHTMPEDDDNTHTTHMQIDEQRDLERDCIFSKKTVAQRKLYIKCSTCQAVRNRGIKDASARTMRQNALRAVQTTRNALRSGNQTKEKRIGRNKAKTKAHNWKATTQARWTNFGTTARKRHRTSDHGMDTENGPTKGHDNHERKRTGSRAGRGKCMGCDSLADLHASFRRTKSTAEQAQETKAERWRRKR